MLIAQLKKTIAQKLMLGFLLIDYGKTKTRNEYFI